VRFAALFLLILAATIAAADLPAGKWAIARQITLPSGFQGGMLYLPLDEQAVAVDSTSEYRVVQRGAVEVPYRMIVENGEILTTVVPSKVVHWTEMPATGKPDTIQITLDLGPHKPSANALSLHLAGQDFEAKAQVYRAQGPAEPGVLYAEDTIYRRGAGFEKTWVQFQPTAERYLRLNIQKDQGALPRIDSVEVLDRMRIARRLVEVPAKLARSEDRKRKETVLALDPGLYVRDLVEASFDVKDELFDRPVSIEVAQETPLPGLQPEYTGFSYGRLTRKLAAAPVILVLDTLPARLLRIVIDNGDDRPLDITSLKIWREQRGLIFNAEASAKYELWYGRKEAPEPAYDLAKLLLTTPPDQLPQAALAAARDLPLAPPPPPPWSETHRALFWVILIAVVLLLLLVIVRAMRKANVAT
jgi:hypothetical protein